MSSRADVAGGTIGVHRVKPCFLLGDSSDATLYQRLLALRVFRRFWAFRGYRVRSARDAKTLYYRVKSAPSVLLFWHFSCSFRFKRTTASFEGNCALNTCFSFPPEYLPMQLPLLCTNKQDPPKGIVTRNDKAVELYWAQHDPFEFPAWKPPRA